MAHSVLTAGARRLMISTLALAGLALGAEARAEGPESETLAHEAKLLMEQKRYTEACPKLAESFRMAPNGEGILELAQCQNLEGRLASAYYSAREATDFAVRDRQHDRAKAARALVKEIEPRLSHLTVVVTLKASSIPGLIVKRDDVAVRRPEWALAEPVDPGTHVVTAEAPGYKAFRRTVTIDHDATSASIEIPELSPADPRLAAKSARSAGDTGADKGGSTGRGQRTAGIVLASLGATALGAGALSALHSANVRSEAERYCYNSTCDAQGTRLREEGTTFSNVATLTLIGGGVAAVSGIAVFVMAPSGERGRARAGVTGLSVGPMGGSVRGQW